MTAQQFELWHQCNTNCSYCYLANARFEDNEAQKLEAMDRAITWCKDISNFKQFDTVGFIGGEFFQGQLKSKALKDKWFELMSVCVDLFKTNLIKSLWMSATLIVGDQQDLIDTLKMFEGVCNKEKMFWLITSYDTKGRFHTPERLANWENNLFKIQKQFPWIFTNTCMIITEDFCDKVIEGKLDLKQFCAKYNTSLFIKPCYGTNGNREGSDWINVKQRMNTICPDFFPHREKVLKMFCKIRQDCPEFLDKMIEQKYRAQNVMKNSHGKFYTAFRSKDNSINENFESLSCGHARCYQSYIDSDACILCDKQLIEEDV